MLVLDCSRDMFAHPTATDYPKLPDAVVSSSGFDEQVHGCGDVARRRMVRKSKDDDPGGGPRVAIERVREVKIERDENALFGDADVVHVPIARASHALTHDC